MKSDRVKDTFWWHPCVTTGLVLLFACLLSAPLALAHSPIVDADLSDWCVADAHPLSINFGNRIIPRVEDSSATLTCGNCAVTIDQACMVADDCPLGEACDLTTNPKTEIAWWDKSFDGSVNDLGTVSITQDNTNLYIAAGLWVDPDPLSLPFGQVAIDYTAGGLNVWHDPYGKLTNSGHCATSVDRACTTDDDCRFCAVSTEPDPSGRLRTCGSGCDPDDALDVCLATETCVGLGSKGLISGLGNDSAPLAGADYLVLFDFSIWLVGGEDASLLVQPANPIDPFKWLALGLPGPPLLMPNPWEPVFGCIPDNGLDGDECDFPPAVNPGASGGSGGPPGSIEIAVPWSAFGCTGCPAACVCPGFGPGDPFRYTMIVPRGTSSLDYTPDGAIEDTFSEAVAGTTTTSADSCGGVGIARTNCEIADHTVDAYIPNITLAHETTTGGRNTGLLLDKGSAGSLDLEWTGSCATGDTEYGIHEGTIGSWNSHSALLCNVVGNTSPVSPTAGSTYYLVVPSNGSVDGSHGTSSAGERTTGASQCHPQTLGTCP